MSKEMEALLAPLSPQQREAVEALVRLSPTLIPPKARRDAVTAYPLGRKRSGSEGATGITPESQSKNTH